MKKVKLSFEPRLVPLNKALYHTCFICGQRCKWWSRRPKLTSSVISDIKPIIYILLFFNFIKLQASERDKCSKIAGIDLNTSTRSKSTGPALRQSHLHLLTVFQCQYQCRCNSISLLQPSLWNSLPLSVHSATSVAKVSQDTFL